MNTQKERKIYGGYNVELLTKKVFLSMNQVGQNIKNNLEKNISNKIEGKCTENGYIKPNSVRVLNYSSGLVNNEKVEFQTTFECNVCYPVEGMLMECYTKTITKAGVHAIVKDEDGNNPVTIFISRDHHFTNKTFSNIKENDKVIVSIIGIRFELNDPYICAIGKLVEKNGGENEYENKDVKPVITILSDNE